MCDVDANQGGFQTPPVGADAEVAPPWYVLTWRALQSEEIVLHIQSLRWKDMHCAQEEGVYLFRGPANGGRGGDDLGAYLLPIHLPGRQVIDGRFVESYHRAQRPGNQVQLVLDDQVRRSQGRVVGRARLRP